MIVPRLLYFLRVSKKLRLPADPMKGQPLSLKCSLCSDGFSTLLGMEFLLLHGSAEVPALRDMPDLLSLAPLDLTSCPTDTLLHLPGSDG